MDGDTTLQSSEPDDGELLRRYVSTRSEDAFATFVRRHLAMVYNVALRKVGGDAYLAQDVSQRVFADLARKAAALQTHATVTGWLFTGTHYAAAQLVRAERRRKVREQTAHAMTQLSRETAGDVDWEQLRPLLDDLVLTLPIRDRDALLLRYFEGLPFAEVGARLQLTDRGARARVERALEKLRVRLSRRGITSSGAAVGLALVNQTSAAAPAGLAAALTGAALSTSATTTALAASALGFMSTAKIFTIGATLVALSAMTFGILERMRAQAAIEEAFTLRQERDVLTAQLARAEQRAKQLEFQSAITPARKPEALLPVKEASTTASAASPASPFEPTKSRIEATKVALASVSNAGGKALSTLDVEHVANVRAWVQQDPADLVTWIATVPAGRQREHTTEAVIAIATETDPEFAFLLASGIDRDLPRMNRRSEVIRAWALRDPAAATRAVAATELSEREHDRLISLISAADAKR